jgi:hypothetical protein
MSLVIEVDQLKAEQAAAVQHEGLIDARLNQSPRRRFRLAVRRHIVNRHRHRD